jgi:hypothetical protein
MVWCEIDLVGAAAMAATTMVTMVVATDAVAGVGMAVMGRRKLMRVPVMWQTRPLGTGMLVQTEEGAGPHHMR